MINNLLKVFKSLIIILCYDIMYVIYSIYFKHGDLLSYIFYIYISLFILIIDDIYIWLFILKIDEVSVHGHF